MKKDYGIIFRFEYYVCMIDFFVCVGLFKEVYEVMIEMFFEFIFVFWRLVLNGCRIWGDFEMGVYVVD